MPISTTCNEKSYAGQDAPGLNPSAEAGSAPSTSGLSCVWPFVKEQAHSFRALLKGALIGTQGIGGLFFVLKKGRKGYSWSSLQDFGYLCSARAAGKFCAAPSRSLRWRKSSALIIQRRGAKAYHPSEEALEDPALGPEEWHSWKFSRLLKRFHLRSWSLHLQTHSISTSTLRLLIYSPVCARSTGIAVLARRQDLESLNFPS